MEDLIKMANERLKKDFEEISVKHKEEMKAWVRENYQLLQNFISLWEALEERERESGIHIYFIVCRCGAKISDNSSSFAIVARRMINHVREHGLDVRTFIDETEKHGVDRKFLKFLSWWKTWSVQNEMGILPVNWVYDNFYGFRTQHKLKYEEKVKQNE
jgi:hypothetical protein